MNIKSELFFLLRKMGGHRLPEPVKNKVGNFLILDKNNKATFFEERRHVVSSLMEKTLHLDGDVIECGVFEGDTTMVMAEKLKELGSNKIIFGVDAFDAFPFDDNDYPFEQQGVIKKKFSKAKGIQIPSIEEVQKKLDEKKLGNIILKKGLVENVLPTLRDKKFCFAIVDVNSYLATKQCIEFLKDRITKGGIMFLDDYNQVGWPGATKAANEILGKQSIITLEHVQAYWINK